MKFKIFIALLLSIIECEAKIIIKRQFSLCKANEFNLGVTNNCKDLSLYDKLECESFTNDLHVLIGFEDQFNYVNSPRGNLIIYSSNSQLYLTNFTNVTEIEVPEKVNTCTRDIPVILREENKMKIIYFTKQGILRYETIPIKCNDEYEFFELNNITIIRQNKRITTIQLNKTEVLFYSSQINFEMKSWFQSFYKNLLNFYRKYIAKNENFQLLRDFSEIIISVCLIVILIILIVIKSRAPAKDVFIFLKAVFDIISKTLNKRETIVEVEAQDFGDIVNLRDDKEILNTQKREIEKEVESVKTMKKVSSNIDIIADIVASNPNVTRRIEKNVIKETKLFNDNNEKCNCKSQCRNNLCSCKKNGKTCKKHCHNGSICLNCETIM